MRSIESKYRATVSKAHSGRSIGEKHAPESTFRRTIKGNCASAIGAQDIFAIFGQLCVCEFVRDIDRIEGLFFRLKSGPITNVDPLLTTQVFDGISGAVIRLIDQR